MIWKWMIYTITLCACTLSRFSCVWLFSTLGTVALQAPLTVGFSRQEHWSGLPGPPPGSLPDPGIKSSSLTPLALAGGFFTTSGAWEAHHYPLPFHPSGSGFIPCCLVTKLYLTLFDSVDCSLSRFSVHGISSGQNNGVDFHFLLQGILPMQGSNPHLLL